MAKWGLLHHNRTYKFRCRAPSLTSISLQVFLAVSFNDPHKHGIGKSQRNIFRSFFIFTLQLSPHDSKLIEADLIINLEIRLILRVTLLCLMCLTDCQSVLSLYGQLHPAGQGYACFYGTLRFNYCFHVNTPIEPALT